MLRLSLLIVACCAWGATAYGVERSPRPLPVPVGSDELPVISDSEGDEGMCEHRRRCRRWRRWW